MNGWFRFLVGYDRIRFASPHPERLLTFTLKQNIPIWDIDGTEGEIAFSILRSHRKNLAPFVESLQPEEHFSREKKGILKLWERFGKRWGFFSGVALFFLFLIGSTFFVWSVEIEGNDEIPTTEICQILGEMGLKTGALKSSVDPALFSLDFQVKDPRFSFASLNFVGTRAIFTVRERESVDKTPPAPVQTANGVAACSGEIVRFEVMAGQIRVKRGQMVKKGDLLISGITEGQNGTFSVVEAKGRVFAKTWHRFETRIPLEAEETVFTGQEEKSVSYEILGLSFSSPHYEKSEFDRAKCIETEERLTFLGRNLPILLKERLWCEIGEKKERITVDRAKKKAYDKYEEYKRETFAIDTEILEERAEWVCDESGVTLRMEVDAVEDIFSSNPFSITEFSEQ